MTAHKVWRFGDNIDTDVLAPGLYMKNSIAELATHCLESVEPRFAREVRPGDVVVGGRGFGMGSSREQAVQALIELGVVAVVAASFGGIFYRNALNHGLLAVTSMHTESLRQDDRVMIDGMAGDIVNITTGERLRCEKLPPHLLAMIADGGLVPHLAKRFAQGLTP